MPDPDRPPTILGPHGEGYCRHCHFVVGLGEDGLLDPHSRGHGNGQECKGSRTRPPKLTPYASRKVAFKTKAELVQCPMCKRYVPLLSDGRMNGHTVSAANISYCKGGFNYPSFRDHEGERG